MASQLRECRFFREVNVQKKDFVERALIFIETFRDRDYLLK